MASGWCLERWGFRVWESGAGDSSFVGREELGRCGRRKAAGGIWGRQDGDAREGLRAREGDVEARGRDFAARRRGVRREGRDLAAALRGEARGRCTSSARGEELGIFGGQ